MNAFGLINEHRSQDICKRHYHFSYFVVFVEICSLCDINFRKLNLAQNNITFYHFKKTLLLFEMYIEHFTFHDL